MELPVSTQAEELLAALILGAALGLTYDLLRPLRRGILTTALTDFLFCLLTTLALLVFMLYGGRGRLRIFALLGMATGASVWFLTVSKPLRRLGLLLWTVFFAPFRRLTKRMKKFLRKNQKNERKMLHLPKKLLK